MSGIKFFAKTIQANLFKKLMSNSHNLINQAHMTISADGIHLHANNAKETIMFIVHLHADKFQEYEFSEELKFGINIAICAKLIKDTNTSDMISFTIKENDPKLYLNIFNAENGVNNKISLMMLNINKIIEGNVDEDSVYHVQFESRIFYQKCKIFSKFSKETRLKGTKKYFSIYIDDDDLSLHSVFEPPNISIFPPNDENFKEIDISYNSNTLNIISKFYSISNMVKFTLDEEFLIIQYVTGDLGECKFILVKED